MIRIAIASYRGTTPLPDHASLLAALADHGVAADVVPWDADVAWSAYALVVLRSCWDYQYRLAEFLAWLDRVEAAGIRVVNAPADVRWNARKTYLGDLAARGSTIVPTVFAAREQLEAALREALSQRWMEVVVKPVVGASAFGVRRWELPRHDLARVVAECDPGVEMWMVQPFMSAVERVGEYSLVFLEGRFSHAVLRRPARGDFRVQQELGGRADPVEPPAPVRRAADRAVASLERTPLYARADLIFNAGEAWLNELELIEPELWLRPAHADRLAAAIAKHASGAARVA